MEAEPQRRRLKVRKPFSDCTSAVTNVITGTVTNTNATATSSQSSSASTATLKSANPKLSTVTKTLVAALNPNKPSAPPPSPIPSTPSRPPPSSASVSGTNDDCEGFEPRSVYTRRQTAIKRKSKGKENTVPWSCPPAPRIRDIGGKTKEDGNNSLSKESMDPRKKKQRATPTGKNVSRHALPQDFIERQRAYFAEIDAFELPEEEVDSDD